MKVLLAYRFQSEGGSVRGQGSDGPGSYYDMGGALPRVAAPLSGAGERVQETGEETSGVSEETVRGE